MEEVSIISLTIQSIINFTKSYYILILGCIFVNFVVVEIIKDMFPELSTKVLRCIAVLFPTILWVTLCRLGITQPVNNSLVDGMWAGLLSTFLYDTGAKTWIAAIKSKIHKVIGVEQK